MTANTNAIRTSLDARGYTFILDHLPAEYFDPNNHLSEHDELYAVLNALAQWADSQALADNASDDAQAALQSNSIEDTLTWWMDAADALDLIRGIELTDEQYTAFFIDRLFNGHADDALAYARTITQ